MDTPLSDRQFQRLLEFRVALRAFQRWSEDQAVRHGLSASQHQLLVAIRGHAGPGAPSIGDVATSLLVRHHTAVGLVARAEGAGLVSRRTDDADRRVVRLALTELGHQRVAALSAIHLAELRRLAPALDALVEVTGEGATNGSASARPSASG